MSVYDVVIVGAGPAGLAAAWSAKKHGMSKVLLLERQKEEGGVLNQCVHDGFGLTLFDQSYTGPEYAQIWKEKILDLVEVKTNCSVVEIRYQQTPRQVCCVGGSKGYEVYQTRTVILACGCRERTIGQMYIPGSRPAGIYTAGCAQYMMNIQNLRPGTTVALFGTGDIGLIMARRLQLEGIRVKLMFGDRPSGLARNYIQCIRDFEIPLKLGYTLLGVHGYQRLKGISIAPLDENGAPVRTQKEYIPCDTLLSAVGLLSETELCGVSGPALSPEGGILIDENGRTNLAGIYACGNVTRIYDLVDDVTVSGIRAGAAAAQDLGVGTSDYAQLALPFRRKESTFQGLDQMTADETVCVLCPKGCRIVYLSKNDPGQIQGNGCPKGRAYAIDERIAPKRILTTTMKVEGRADALLPVHTTKPIPRERLREAVCFLNRMQVKLPVKRGKIIVEHLLGTDADVAASKQMERAL